MQNPSGQDEARRALAAVIADVVDVWGDHSATTEVRLDREDWAIVIAALRAPSTDWAAEEMRTELRPFADGEGEGLDEVVVTGACGIHAETMSDTSLWIGIDDGKQGLLHIWINALRRNGKVLLTMTASDEGERDTIRALPLPPDRKGAEE